MSKAKEIIEKVLSMRVQKDVTTHSSPEAKLKVEFVPKKKEIQTELRNRISSAKQEYAEIKNDFKRDMATAKDVEEFKNNLDKVKPHFKEELDDHLKYIISNIHSEFSISHNDGRVYFSDEWFNVKINGILNPEYVEDATPDEWEVNSETYPEEGHNYSLNYF